MFNSIFILSCLHPDGWHHTGHSINNYSFFLLVAHLLQKKKTLGSKLRYRLLVFSNIIFFFVPSPSLSHTLMGEMYRCSETS